CTSGPEQRADARSIRSETAGIPHGHPGRIVAWCRGEHDPGLGRGREDSVEAKPRERVSPLQANRSGGVPRVHRPGRGIEEREMSLREANLSTRLEIDFGEGEMAERIRAFDWSKTPLGPVSAWSPALRTALRIMLANRFPHVLWWGPKYIQFYNDPYIPIPGTKHPDVAFGRPASECWAEIWHVIGPLIDRPFGGGPATWDDDIALEVRRHGYLEESHFVIAYSPVPDETEESGIGGVLATVHEITEKIVAERRVRTLRDLGARLSEAKTAEEACAVAAETFAEDAKDVPFALIYLIDHGGASARLAGTAGISGAEGVAPVEI